MRHSRDLADRSDREKAASKLDQSLIVEAAAGTGKTTLLVSRIINLIKSGKALPEEIVAITFTERAAAELKAKLQERLAEEAAASSGKITVRLAEALWGLDRMQVTTIHAFCTSILKERPVEAGIDPGFRVADELTASLVSAETWDQWIAKQMDRNNPVLSRALSIGITLDNMHELALAICSNRDIADYLPEPASPDSQVADFTEDLKTTAGRLEKAGSSCRRAEDRALSVIGDLAKHARELDRIEDEETRQAYIFTRIRIRSPRNLGNVSNWASKDGLKEVRELIGSLRDRHDKIKASIAHDTLASLARELLSYEACYREAKASQGLLDFHDLLLFARDLLKGHSHVREYFRKRFRYILVDEFQDTDPLQAEIVFYLAGEPCGEAVRWQEVEVLPGKLFLVGDPKQSIYRFRRADIEMYASAKEVLGPGQGLNIHQNFRCAESIIAVVNSIFSDLIKPPDHGTYQPEYVALDFGRDEDSLPKQHGTILLFPPDAVRAAVENAEQRRLYEFRSVAAFIRRVVEKERWEIWDKKESRLRPLMLRDIAILMRTQTGLDSLEQALRLYDIDYRVIGGKRFFLCEEVQQLLAVLLAVDNPNDRVALVAALRSPFFGISDEDLFLYHAAGGVPTYLGDAAGTRLERAFELLGMLHAQRNRASPEVLLDTLYKETKAPVIFLLRPNGEQRVANLLKIAEIARALADRGVLTFRAFVRWLAERKDEDAEEAEAATMEAGDDFVRLLTIHKAKGLEFPMVILADLASRRRTGEKFIVDRESKEIGIRLRNKEMGIQTGNYDRLSQYEELRREAEERRMLYVAMTRARDLLVIPAHFSKGELPAGALLSYLAPLIQSPPASDDKPDRHGIRVFDTSKLNLQPPEAPPFRIPLDPDAPEPEKAAEVCARFDGWRESRAASLAEFRRGRNLKTATEEKEIPSGAGRSEGVLFGKIVHVVLERLDWAHADLLDEIASEEASAIGAGKDMVAQAAEVVRRTLSSDLIRRIIASDRYYKEVPFVFKEDGTIVEGVIDVLFEEGGRIGIVDFKTDKVPKNALPSRAETYRTQVETYRRAVTEACGKPPEETILFFLHPMVAVTVPPEY